MVDLINSLEFWYQPRAVAGFHLKDFGSETSETLKVDYFHILC